MQNTKRITFSGIKKVIHSPLKIALLGIGLSVSFQVFSQENTQPDCKGCKSLNEVIVFGFSPEKFMSGLKVQKIDSINLGRFQFQNLSDFLQFQAPLAMKSYGAGQLTTISFRGTSANHTAVLWNGININSPTVGQTDFSTIPVIAFDQMAIQYGSSASCVGSDAVGGSILLSSLPNWNKKSTNLIIGGQIGKEAVGGYGTGSGNIGLRFYKVFKRGILSGKTLLYGSRNQVQITSNSTKTDKKGREYLIEPTDTNQKGFVQDLYFRFNTKSNNKYRTIYLNTWLTDNKLIITPIIVNLREITQTQAYRFIAGTELDNTSIKLGFIRDILDYGKGDFINPSHASTDRYIIRGEHDFSFDKTNTTIRIGSEIVHYATKVDGYGGNIIHENRGDLYALIKKSFGWNNQPNKVTSTLNLRQALSSNYKAPFTPAFGLDYKLYTNKNTQLYFSGNVSRSYRLPTLNERYWQVLGNPNIQPEKGFNKEVGLDLKYSVNQFSKSSVSVNVFHNLIDNWTYWNPAKNYRVENLQQVLSKGIEITTTFKYNDFEKQQTSGIILAYSLTDASQQKVYDVYAQDIIGKQLIYVPRHAISSNLYYGRKKWNLGLQGIFNSARYITFDHSGQPFPPYIILNSTFTRKLLFAHNEANLVLQANNLTNTIYPNVKKNAMPGINFQVALVFNFQK